MYRSWCGTGVNNRTKHPPRPQNDLISFPTPLSFCFSKRSLAYSPSPPLQGRIQEMEELPWSVFCPAWPSPLRTSLNHSFAAPQESKSMGGTYRCGWHSTMRTGRGDVWRREKWHYGAGGLPDWSRRREKKKKIIRRWSQIKASGGFELRLHTCDLLDEGLQKCQDFLVFAFVSIIRKHFCKIWKA